MSPAFFTHYQLQSCEGRIRTSKEQLAFSRPTIRCISTTVSRHPKSLSRFLRPRDKGVWLPISPPHSVFNEELLVDNF